MAYDDALFQLGMDLTRSSTAQKEDHGKTAHVAHDTQVQSHQGSRKSLIERDGVRFAGNHLIIDLFGATRLDDIEHVERTLRQCAEAAGATVLNMHLHRSENDGVSGVVMLAGSHISFHSWPHEKFAALDVFISGGNCPAFAVDVVRDAFGARDAVIKRHRRGEDLDSLAWQACNRQPSRVVSMRLPYRLAPQGEGSRSRTRQASRRRPVPCARTCRAAAA